MGSRIYIIAEAGVNHNGCAETARKLVDAAASSGADAVKFQTFITDEMVTEQAEQALYQKRQYDKSMSQKEMLRSLELSFSDFHDLKRYCQNKNIDFLSTPFDTTSLRFLVEELELGIIKIPSGEITNGPFLYECAKTNCELIVSTGMSTIEEISEALLVIYMGFNHNSPNEFANLRKNLSIAEISQVLRGKISLLHCTTDYPTRMEDVNLHAMVEMKKYFNLEVGYSDHTMGVVAGIAAASLGAAILEKHLTLDRSMPGPDQKSSLEPNEFKGMVSGIRDIEVALGTGVKVPCDAESQNRKAVRKSIVTTTEIKIGDRFTVENISIKRPGSGISPMKYWEYIGRFSNRDYRPGELLQEG